MKFLFHLQSTLENYEEIPIEKFGKGLLLGMGWVPERGIGKTPKMFVCFIL